MKVKEMIAALSKFNPESEIEFPVQTHTKRYPSVYVQSEPSSVSRLGYESIVMESPFGKVRIQIDLPKGYSISERK